MTDVLVAGESVVEFLPGRSGPLAEVEAFTRRAGGAPANVAAGLARLGRPPWFWTRLGEDAFGDFLAQTLRDRGVPDRFFERDPEAQTPLAFVSRGAGADGGAEASGASADTGRTFAFYRDGTADTRLQAGTVPEDALAAVSWVYVGAVPFADDPSRSVLFNLIDRARDQGCTIVFDPNARPELWDEYAFGDTVRAVLARADVLKATPSDLRAAGFDGPPGAVLRSVVDHGPHTAIVTRGESGAVARATGGAPWGQATIDHAGYDVDPVDVTGAGDAFLAGAVTALADGTPLAEAVAFANAVGALATTAVGAMDALPDRRTVEEFRVCRSADSG
jgi:fructokinase